ncbi:MAG: hypothetical protein IBX62_05310 [Coriobacteriia bacterium]|nr:hypothetical protein [Coriobacteriia bacterium]
MARDEAFERMLEIEYDKAEPILRRTLLERAPAFGVSAETLQALRALPEGRYTREELERSVTRRGGVRAPGPGAAGPPC